MKKHDGMKSGKGHSFFPSEASVKHFPRAGEIKDHAYPDTAEAIHQNQQDAVKKVNASMPKPGFRH